MALIRRIVVALLSTRAGAAFFRAFAPSMDRLVLRLTRGRRTVSDLLLPTLMLTTTGRRSGVPRQQPLVFVRDGRDLVVVGSNWGQAHHPAWTHNLLAEPDATAAVNGEEIPVRAHLADGDDARRLYQRFVDIAPNYGEYTDWSGGREIRVFRLTPR